MENPGAEAKEGLNEATAPAAIPADVVMESNRGGEATGGLNEARAPAATSADVTAQAPAPRNVAAQAPAPADVTAQAPAPADVTAQAPAPADVTAQAPAPRNVATLAPTSANAETPETDVKDAGKLSFPCFTRAIGTKAQFNGGFTFAWLSTDLCPLSVLRLMYKYDWLSNIQEKKTKQDMVTRIFQSSRVHENVRAAHILGLEHGVMVCVVLVINKLAIVISVVRILATCYFSYT